MATPIGTLVVEMTANTAKFRADLDKASTSAKGFNTTASASIAKTQQAFAQVAQAGRTMAQTIASNVSPAVAEAATAIGVMTTSLTRLPIPAGLAVSALAALAIVAQRLAQNLNETQEAQSKLFLALERGDVSALRGQLKGLGEQFDLLRRQQQGASEFFDRLKTFDLRGAFESAVNALQYGLSKGLDDLRTKSEAAGKALAELIPREVKASVAAFTAQVQGAIAATAQFDATLAESVNDEEAFTRAIERSIAALKDQARATDTVNRLKAKEAIDAARVDTLLSPEARAAEEAKITRELEQQLVLTGEKLNLESRSLRERQRAGVLGIRERGQAAFPAEPGIEDVARYEGMAAGIAVDAETLARARAAAKGYDSALADLRKTQSLVGDASSNLAAQQSLILGQMQKLIADGVQPQDAALTKLTREYNDLQREMNLIADTTVVDALAQQTAELSMTTREVARYRAQLQLSGDASDYLREKVGEMAAQLDDQQQIIAGAEQITQAFGAGLVDLAIDMENFDPKEFLKGIARMITAMAIATLVAQGLKAALGFFGPTAPAGDFSGVGADVLRGVPTTASGGVVTSPQVRMVGEAGPEAIIPLSQLGGGEVNVSVEIINQTGTPVSQQTEQTTGPDGQRMLRVFLRKEVAGAIGDGSLDPVMSSAFGLKRKGVSR